MRGTPERLPRSRRHPERPVRHDRTRFAERLEERREEDERNALGPERYTVKR